MSHAIKPRDIGKVLLWLLLYLLILTPLFFSYWLIGDTEIFERSWLWTIAGVAALLTLSWQKGHYPLVLGLCSLTFWIKVEPYLGIYLFCASSLLFATLHLQLPRKRLLFYVLLGLLVLIIPKSLPLLFSTKPGLWLWLRETLLLGFFLRYLCYENEFQEGRLREQRFFEHFGYILFIPQLLKLLNIKPSAQFENHLEYPENLWPAARLFLLGSLKLGLYHLHLILPMGLQEGGAGSFVSAWYQIITHYLLWFLWLSAHFDYAVFVARLLGAKIPANFRFPLLATSPRDFWQRWQVLHHHFLKEFIYQPLRQNLRISLNRYAAILLTFIASGFLFTSFWIGSICWLPASSFFLQWLPFFLLQGFLVCLQIKLARRLPTPSFFTKGMGWIFTQTSFALCCLWLSGLQRFPRDMVTPDNALLILRRALLLE